MADLSSVWRFIAGSGAVQAVIIGGILAYLTAMLIIGLKIRAIRTSVNGWVTSMRCGTHSDSVLHRAACARFLPGTGLPEESAYWTTVVDGSGHALSGRRDYILHFPAGQLPPNDAFWSLTMADTWHHFVTNPIARYSVGDRSDLAANPDGSVDVYIQRAAPAGHESNWLPAPAGGFELWLRVYRPGAAILSGEYEVPPVTPTGRAPAATRALSEIGIRPRYLITAALLVLVAWVTYQRHQLPFTFDLPALVVWVLGALAFIYLWPQMTYYGGFRRAIVRRGFGGGPVPVNTLYAVPELASPTASNRLLRTGANHDTLYLGAWLDLRKGPRVLHVPDFAGRYYSVQFTDPTDGADFAYVGTRVTGTGAGDYLIAGPGWQEAVPSGMTKVSSPRNEVLVFGRVLVYGDADLAAARELEEQIRMEPLED